MTQPNILFVMSDDHAAHAISAYGWVINDPLGQLGSNGPVLEPEWELFDLVADPAELHNVISDPAHRAVAIELRAELARQQAAVGDEPHPAAQVTLDTLLA